MYLKVIFYVCVRVRVNELVGDSVCWCVKVCVYVQVCVVECVSAFGFECECVFGCRCVSECVRVC